MTPLLLATADAAKGMTLGTHGTTYGGNPLAMAVGNAAPDGFQPADVLPVHPGAGRLPRL